jgi:2-polyprenyl-3-methyl-5-hydroxy-6-metoxy-1,4-benzoquinol methylase
MSHSVFTVIRGILKRYGPSGVKKRLWDQEFSGTHWDFINDTKGDCVYSHLEKHLQGGTILDLGCGPGNTANELAFDAYSKYVGVDISEAALEKARKRSLENGRGDKNSFVCSDFLDYHPTQKFDVVLFRESMYHIPLGKVQAVLEHFTKYMREGGVIVVRMNVFDHKGQPKKRLLDAIEVMNGICDLIESVQYGDDGPTVLVLRPHELRTATTASVVAVGGA